MLIGLENVFEFGLKVLVLQFVQALHLPGWDDQGKGIQVINGALMIFGYECIV
jgi:hypothetical protein